jgi:hypothetical protein
MTKLYETFGWFQFAIINVPVEHAADVIVEQWRDPKFKPGRWPIVKQIAKADARKVVVPLHAPVSLHLTRPQTGAGFMLMDAPDGKGTATLFTSNGDDGNSAVLGRLSRTISGSVFMFRADALLKFPNPMNFMHVINNFETTRMVRTMRDPGWDFFEKGTPLPFENTDYYKRQRVRDRINPQILEEYVRKLGIGSFDEEVWINPKIEAIYLFQEGFTPYQP